MQLKASHMMSCLVIWNILKHKKNGDLIIGEKGLTLDPACGPEGFFVEILPFVFHKTF